MKCPMCGKNELNPRVIYTHPQWKHSQELICDTCYITLREQEVDPPKTDIINHPPHYTFGKFEVIDVIEDWKLNYHLGNAIKYIARAGKKHPLSILTDLKKAEWYLKREIENVEKNYAKNDEK
jgi:hypothetical protein